MDPLLRYYLNQAGRGIGGRGCIGPIYSVPPIYQRGYGIGSFLCSLWRMVRPILWRGAKTVGRETLRTGGKILSDMADNSGGTPAGDIVSKNASVLIGKFKGRGRKRKAATPKKPKRAVGKKPKLAPANPTYRDIFALSPSFTSRPWKGPS